MKTNYKDLGAVMGKLQNLKNVREQWPLRLKQDRSVVLQNWKVRENERQRLLAGTNPLEKNAREAMQKLDNEDAECIDAKLVPLPLWIHKCR